MVDETRFIDADSYQGRGGGGGGKELSFRAIVMLHLHRITQLASHEWSGGYWEDRPYGTGGTIHMYNEATHEAYSNAVDALADLLAPYFDAEMTKDEEVANKELDQLKKMLDEKRSGKPTLLLAKVRVKRRLFRALSKFLHRQGYLEMGTYEEGVE